LDKLLNAAIHCHTNNVLHRDIKEKNIFVNCRYGTIQKNGKVIKKRYITELVLADFNISKYAYKKIAKRTSIMTSSHRAPEIWDAMHNGTKINYNEKIDVWAVCMVLVYVITGRSFYQFLSDSYIQIDNSIIYDANKIKIALRHFLKIYAYRHLKHISLFTQLIYMGICPYEQRCSVKDIYTTFQLYIQTKGPKYANKYAQLDLTQMQHESSTSPEYIPTDHLIRDTQFIREFHDIVQNTDVILYTFYRTLRCPFYLDMFRAGRQSIYESGPMFDKYKLYGLYLLIVFVINDGRRSYKYYIDMIRYITSDYAFTRQLNHKRSVQKSIIELMSDSRFNIIC
jgi:serine/threonine protein kinase